MLLMFICTYVPNPTLNIERWREGEVVSEISLLYPFVNCLCKAGRLYNGVAEREREREMGNVGTGWWKVKSQRLEQVGCQGKGKMGISSGCNMSPYASSYCIHAPWSLNQKITCGCHLKNSLIAFLESFRKCPCIITWKTTMSTWYSFFWYSKCRSIFVNKVKRVWLWKWKSGISWDQNLIGQAWNLVVN